MKEMSENKSSGRLYSSIFRCMKSSGGRSKAEIEARRLDARGLPSNSQRLNKERGEIGPRPNAKTRNGDDWHKFILPPEHGQLA
jgi:hypothetical protein